MAINTSAHDQISSEPVIRKAVPFLKSAGFHVVAFLYSGLFSFFLSSIRWRGSRRAFWLSVAPTLSRTYPTRPELQVRLFYPQNNRNRDDGSPPVFFLIHGGGWVIGDSRMDDEQGRLLADRHGFLVVGLNYRMAPHHRFPTAIYDCATLIQAVLRDESLEIDHERVVVGGFSAGAVMTLCLAQLPEIGPLVKALVSIQPMTDFTGQVRPPGGISPWGRKDRLPLIQPMYDWAYVPTGTNMRDPLLSPLYATRKDIPHPVFFITGSGDVLCDETALMARRLAGFEGKSGFGKTEPWEQGGVRYMCAKDMPHCFTHFWERIEDQTWETRRQQETDKVWQEVGEWTERVLR